MTIDSKKYLVRYEVQKSRKTQLFILREDSFPTLDRALEHYVALEKNKNCRDLKVFLSEETQITF